MSLRLVQEASISEYPYHHQFRIGQTDPERPRLLHWLQGALSMINAGDHKFLEEASGVTISFKDPNDDDHFIDLTEIDLEQAVRKTFPRTKFETPENIDEKTSRLLLACFQAAAEKSGIKDRFKIEAQPDGRIAVTAKTFAAYLKFWHQISDSDRQLVL